ncbi:MAG TPA: SGNH/GDSL hydrolase family protein [Solirubrobacteraceae bacterium]|nr:SGNH/GDSL hydrolase family protein [Solirubrobacteraceae bacterium]
MKSVVRMPANAKRALKAALVLVCAGAMLATVGGQALAKTSTTTKKSITTKKSKLTPTTPITKGSTYLALGDSITFGYEEAGVVPTPNYQDAASFVGYPEILGSELHLKVVNAACPGETSSSMINDTAQSNGCENTPGKGNVGYRTLYPLHVKYSGSQLAFAVSYLKKHQNVRLVSLMIGANDGLLCEETTADQCTGLTEEAGVAETVEKNVRTILSTIRSKAHYNGQIAIENYYSIDSASATDNQQETFLDQSIDAAAKPYHVEVADGYGAFQTASAHSGGDSTCTAGLLTELGGTSTTCGIHPSYAGASLLALALEKVIHFQ